MSYTCTDQTSSFFQSVSGKEMLFNNRRSLSPYSTMEEVWEEVNVSSLHQDHHPHTNTRHPTNLAYNFQDFLARPFDRDQASGLDFSHFGYSVAAAPTPPQTSLCLNSVRESYCLDNNNPGLLSSQPPQTSFYSCSAFPPFWKKRSSTESDDSTGDRRHKRMIKNRESASRSRARKQSYTNELEAKVAHLEKEHKSLRKQQEEFYLAAAVAVVQLPKKHNLRRTSSAPF